MFALTSFFQLPASVHAASCCCQVKRSWHICFSQKRPQALLNMLLFVIVLLCRVRASSRPWSSLRGSLDTSTPASRCVCNAHRHEVLCMSFSCLYRPFCCSAEVSTAPGALYKAVLSGSSVAQAPAAAEGVPAAFSQADQRMQVLSVIQGPCMHQHSKQQHV